MTKCFTLLAWSALGCVVLALLAWGWLHRPIPSSEALRQYESGFQTSPVHVTERDRIRPLVLGDHQTPRVVATRVLDRGMPGRAGAVWYLGMSGDRATIPLLERLALDPTEQSGVRMQAMLAVGSLDPQLGRALALQLAGEPDPLGRFAGFAAVEPPEQSRLTRWDFFFVRGLK